jgi:tetratricopeptide (TPR) repeat protein
MSGVDSAEMNRQALELLGALPFFDLDLGADVVSLIGRNIDDDALRQWSGQYVFDLAASGLLEDVKGLLRVPEPQRNRFAHLWADKGDLITEALERFEAHASNQLRHRLNRILGSRPAELLIQSVRVAADRQGTKSFDQLIDTVHESERLGRSTDAENAAATLRRYLGDEDRRLVFLDALAKWQIGNRAAAASGFEQVLSVRSKDKAEGIAAHLLATYRHELEIPDDGKPIQLLARAERALRAVHDNWGLSLTYSTHGRVLRDHAKRVDPADAALLQKSLAEYSRAEKALAKIAVDDLPDRSRSLGWIRLAKAETLNEQGEVRAAIEIAEDVLSFLPDSAYEKLYCRSLLARLYRDGKRVGDALEVLNRDVIRRVRATRRTDAEVARALNILATVQRASGDLAGAERSAAESFALGESLGDRRHIVHSGQTLAAIKFDRLGPDHTSSEVRALRSVLYRLREQGVAIDDMLLRLPNGNQSRPAHERP